MPKIEESQSIASTEAIQLAQTRINLSFPSEYLNFLSNFNGGYPEPGAFNVQWQPGQAPSKDWVSSSMGRFYAIDSAVRSSDLVRVNTVTFRDRFPRGTFAFAYDAASNQLLIATVGPFAGKVLFWCKDHEAEQGQEAGYDNVGVIADSFQKFLNGLHEP